MKKSERPVMPILEVGEGKRGEQGYLGYLLRQANVAYRLHMDRALADLGVTPPQFSVLTIVSAYPGLSNADLARLSLLTPQTVSVIVNNLVRSGLLKRRPHAVHGRIQHLDITENGRELLTDCRKRVHKIEQQLAMGFSHGEQAIIRHWLVSIAVERGDAQM